jgi:hypothetical protein
MSKEGVRSDGRSARVSQDLEMRDEKRERGKKDSKIG